MATTLLLFAFTDRPASCINLSFFQDFGMVDIDIDYILIINGDSCSIPLSDRWEQVLYRENTGLDFGAWNHAISTLGLRAVAQYEHVVLMNDTVRGPFLDSGSNIWLPNFTSLLSETTRLAGVSINCHCTPRYLPASTGLIDGEILPHVQSMFLVMSTDTLLRLYHIISDMTETDKVKIIYQKEVGISTYLLSKGFNITCILKPYQVDYQDPRNRTINTKNSANGDPWYKNTYFGRSLMPSETIFFKCNRGVSEKELEEATAARRSAALTPKTEDLDYIFRC